MILEARNLSVAYPLPRGLISRPAPLTVVHDVSFRLERGKTLGIVGESGCGKSTLGRALLHLLPAAKGEVLWAGENPAQMAPETLRKARAKRQIIFQDPIAALDPRMTVLKSLTRPLATFEPGITRAESRDRAAEVLQRTGLSADYLARYPHELSGGQAQRVGIARALIARPEVIICDEPVSALDVSIQAQVVNLLLDLQEDLGLALVFISHNLAVVRQMADEVMVMCLGRVVEQAPAEAFHLSPQHPYSQALRQAVPEPDPLAERSRRGKALQGELPSVHAPPPGCVFASRCDRARPECRTTRPELAPRGAALVACPY
ncbi:ABC transporter ATP-binding protein [Stagnihabitans tardus]|uniref:ATP-binding cassette domain-containing protein n=1 Tax=Stagnihabitans tardus TaxID=2699202 RepID=A0AAE4YD41_9RHOB|nr:oligopeptide/dipeptide ABC transporter ATP-binding protein [Stagnihabitans tardus]NBZ87760.1 ATP-binding cassette domain-containing protein [Stagnihabitans tardus]